MRFSFEVTLRISFSKIVRGWLNARLGRIHSRNTSREPPPRFVTPAGLNLRMRHTNSGKWEAYFVNRNSPHREFEEKPKRRFYCVSLAFTNFSFTATVWIFGRVLKAAGYMATYSNYLIKFEWRNVVISQNFYVWNLHIWFLAPEISLQRVMQSVRIISLARIFIPSALQFRQR